MDQATRRETLIGAAALLGCGLAPRASWANAVTAIVMQLTGGHQPGDSDRLRLTLPSVYQRGDAVPLVVEVEGPITETDYVKHIHLVAEANPIPEIVSFHFTSRSGRPRVLTRVRLAKPQHVVAVAEMADGSVLMARVPVDVKTDGCT